MEDIWNFGYNKKYVNNVYRDYEEICSTYKLKFTRVKH